MGTLAALLVSKEKNYNGACKRIKELKETISELEKIRDPDSLRETLAVKTEQIDKLTAENAKLKVEVKENRNQIEDLERQLAGAKKNISESEAEREQFRIRLAALQRLEKKLEADLLAGEFEKGALPERKEDAPKDDIREREEEERIEREAENKQAERLAAQLFLKAYRAETDQGSCFSKSPYWNASILEAEDDEPTPLEKIIAHAQQKNKDVGRLGKRTLRVFEEIFGIPVNFQAAANCKNIIIKKFHDNKQACKEDILVKVFKARHNAKRNSSLSFFRNSYIDGSENKLDSLEKIIKHARGMSDGFSGNRSHRVLIELFNVDVRVDRSETLEACKDRIMGKIDGVGEEYPAPNVIPLGPVLE